MRARGKRVAMWAGGIGIVVLVATGIALRSWVVEEYWIWRLRHGDQAEKERVAHELERRGIVRAIPALIGEYEKSVPEVAIRARIHASTVDFTLHPPGFWADRLKGIWDRDPEHADAYLRPFLLANVEFIWVAREVVELREREAVVPLAGLFGLETGDEFEMPAGLYGFALSESGTQIKEKLRVLRSEGTSVVCTVGEEGIQGLEEARKAGIGVPPSTESGVGLVYPASIWHFSEAGPHLTYRWTKDGDMEPMRPQPPVCEYCGRVLTCSKDDVPVTAVVNTRLLNFCSVEHVDEFVNDLIVGVRRSTTAHKTIHIPYRPVRSTR